MEPMATGCACQWRLPSLLLCTPANPHCPLLPLVPQMDAVQERTKQSSGLQLLIGTALAAVHKPAKVTLPYLGLSYSLLVISGGRAGGPASGA